MRIAVHVLGGASIAHMMGSTPRPVRTFVFPENIARTGPVIVSRTPEDHAPFVEIEWR